MTELTPVWDVLVYVVLPLWVLAAFADYLCHRTSDIEHTSGVRESILHFVLFAEAGLPIIAALFLRVNALIFVFIMVMIVVHELTVHWDLRIAMRSRKITATEQQVHGVLEMMPVTAALLLAILHWQQAFALFGFGPESADFSIALKEPPSWAEIAWPATGFLVFGILPYLDELWRDLRARWNVR